MLWHLRPPEQGDVSFIFSSYLKSFRDAPAVAGCPNTLYYKKAHKALENMLANPDVRVVVACDPAEPGIVFGYGIGEVGQENDITLHWVYVKHSFRSFGIGKAMEAELKKAHHDTVFYSNKTRVTESLMKSRNYIYDPYRAWVYSTKQGRSNEN